MPALRPLARLAAAGVLAAAASGGLLAGPARADDASLVVMQDQGPAEGDGGPGLGAPQGPLVAEPADLAVRVAGPAIVVAGEPVELDVVVFNTGAGDAPAGTTLTVVPRKGVGPVGVTAARGWRCQDAGCIADAGAAGLSAGGFDLAVFTVEAPVDVNAGGQVELLVAVSPGPGEPEPALNDNTAAWTATATAPAPPPPPPPPVEPPPADQPPADQPAGDQPAGDQPAGDQPAAGQPPVPQPPARVAPVSQPAPTTAIGAGAATGPAPASAGAATAAGGSNGEPAQLSAEPAPGSLPFAAQEEPQPPAAAPADAVVQTVLPASSDGSPQVSAPLVVVGVALLVTVSGLGARVLVRRLG